MQLPAAVRNYMNHMFKRLPNAFTSKAVVRLCFGSWLDVALKMSCVFLIDYFFAFLFAWFIEEEMDGWGEIGG